MPIERLEDAAQGIWASLQGEKCQLDCLILIAKQISSVHCHLAAPPGHLENRVCFNAARRTQDKSALATASSTPEIRLRPAAGLGGHARRSPTFRAKAWPETTHSIPGDAGRNHHDGSRLKSYFRHPQPAAT